MGCIAFIPARGGSKGVPGKNIRDFRGKPLIVHSIEQALAAPEVDAVYVSTDDADIARISKEAGASIIDRPADIAGDTATTESAVAHGFQWLEEHGVEVSEMVLLQCTSPLRPKDGISQAVQNFHSGNCDSLLSISPTHRFFWTVNGDTAEAQYDYINRPRRQDMGPEDIRYVENGSLYVFSKKHFDAIGNRLGGKIGYVVFDEEYSPEIDTVMDFDMLEKIAKNIEDTKG